MPQGPMAVGRMAAPAARSPGAPKATPGSDEPSLAPIQSTTRPFPSVKAADDGGAVVASESIALSEVGEAALMEEGEELG